MRRQLTAYVGGEDFARLKEEAAAAGLSLSRYIQERLVQSNGRAAVSLSESKLAATEKKIIDANRSFIAQAIRPLSKQVTMLLAMLDQFALSMLSHLPEIPEAQRNRRSLPGARRHRGWRQKSKTRSSRWSLRARTERSLSPARKVPERRASGRRQLHQ